MSTSTTLNNTPSLLKFTVNLTDKSKTIKFETTMYIDPEKFISEIVFERAILGEEAPLRECMCCQINSRLVLDCPSMTMYQTDLHPDHPENPNRDLPLCPDCAQQHLEEMNLRWSEYHSALL